MEPRRRPPWWAAGQLGVPPPRPSQADSRSVPSGQLSLKETGLSLPALPENSQYRLRLLPCHVHNLFLDVMLLFTKELNDFGEITWE